MKQLIQCNSASRVSTPPDLVNLLVRSRQTGLDRDPLHTTLMRIAEADSTDAEVIEMLRESVGQAELLSRLDPDPFRATNPNSSLQLPGTIGIGFIAETGLPWLIYPEMLTNHLLVVGRSGGGKTNLILLILAQILEHRRNDQSL